MGKAGERTCEPQSDLGIPRSLFICSNKYLMVQDEPSLAHQEILYFCSAFICNHAQPY